MLSAGGNREVAVSEARRQVRRRLAALGFVDGD
jgi:hypothetical protein